MSSVIRKRVELDIEIFSCSKKLKLRTESRMRFAKVNRRSRSFPSRRTLSMARI